MQACAFSRTVTTQNWANELNLTLTGAIKALSEIAIIREVLGAGEVDDAGGGDAN